MPRRKKTWTVICTACLKIEKWLCCINFWDVASMALLLFIVNTISCLKCLSKFINCCFHPTNKMNQHAEFFLIDECWKVLSNHWIHLSSDTVIRPFSTIAYFFFNKHTQFYRGCGFYEHHLNEFINVLAIIFFLLSFFGDDVTTGVVVFGNSSFFGNEYGLHSYKVNKFTCLLSDPLLIVWDKKKQQQTNKQFATKALAWLIWFDF